MHQQPHPLHCKVQFVLVSVIIVHLHRHYTQAWQLLVGGLSVLKLQRQVLLAACFAVAACGICKTTCCDATFAHS